jgi:hypothetical protein
MIFSQFIEGLAWNRQGADVYKASAAGHNYSIYGLHPYDGRYTLEIDYKPVFTGTLADCKRKADEEDFYNREV